MGYNLFYALQRLLEQKEQWRRIAYILQFKEGHENDFKKAVDEINKADAKIEYIKENCR